MAEEKINHPTLPLLAEFQQKIPILYDDIVPMEQQSKALMKAR